MFSSTRLSLFHASLPSTTTSLSRSRSLSTTPTLLSALGRNAADQQAQFLASTTGKKLTMREIEKMWRPKKSPLIRIEGAYKTYKPITPSIRHLKMPYNPHLYTGDPIRALTIPKRKTGGRNKAGRITMRSVGGGAKQRIRIVDFLRNEPGKCDVIRIEYDPRRSAHIALIRQRNPRAKQIFSYILAPEGLRAGDVVESFRDGIPDGLVEGYTDERRRVREVVRPTTHARHNYDPGMHRADVPVHGGPTAVPEIMEPVPKEERRGKEEEYEEGSVAQLEAELAALEARAREAEVGMEMADIPPVEETMGDPEVEDGVPSEPALLAGAGETISASQPAAPTHATQATATATTTATATAPAEDPLAQFENPMVPPSMPHHATQGTTASQLALGNLRTTILKPGNVLPLRLIPSSVPIHAISLHPYGPMKLVRSAGSWGEVMSHEEGGRYSVVRLQSGEIRRVGQECCATVGKVSNEHWKGRQLGKAGRSRRLGRRPHVRGVAMNAVDHPHGGGRGKSKGNKHPRSIYGWLAKGKRTRVPGRKRGNRFVIQQRPGGPHTGRTRIIKQLA